VCPVPDARYLEQAGHLQLGQIPQVGIDDDAPNSRRVEIVVRRSSRE
jgi:hypothetical protein